MADKLTEGNPAKWKHHPPRPVNITKTGQEQYCSWDAPFLSGYYKIKIRDLGYRAVYQLVIDGEVMRIIVISIRDDEEVYKEAERRSRCLMAPKE